MGCGKTARREFDDDGDVSNERGIERDAKEWQKVWKEWVLGWTGNPWEKTGFWIPISWGGGRGSGGRHGGVSPSLN